MDLASIIGVILGFGCLVMGFSMDGGGLGSLVSASAFIIVIGGSFGSVALSFGVEQLKKLPALIIQTFIPPKSTLSQTLDLIVKLSETARKEGLLSVEKLFDEKNVPNTKAKGKNKNKEATDPLLKQGMMLVIDGVDLEQIRDIMETQIRVYEEKAKREIAMFESLGGYAPTYGMIGTIMGLIKGLSNMEDPTEMTAAIAVAFTATLYGVASANVLFLPIASKLKLRLNNYLLEKEMILEGVCSIRNGMNSKMLREKLSIYLTKEVKPGKKKAGKAKGDKA